MLGHRADAGSNNNGTPTKGPVIPPEAPFQHAVILGAQIAALLRTQLVPSGKAATIRALLKHGGLTMPFKTLEAGTVIIDWYQVPSGATLAKKSKAKPMLVAAGRLTFPAAGTGQVKLRLTSQGKRLLRHAGRVRLTAKGTFTPRGQASVSNLRSFAVVG